MSGAVASPGVTGGPGTPGGPYYRHFQEGARRLAAAMEGVPDQTPITAQIHEFTMRQLGVPARRFYTRPDILVPGELAIQQAYGIDVATLTYDIYTIEAEALGQKVVYSDDFVPDVDRSAPLLRGPEDLARIRTPDFERTGRFSQVIDMFSRFRSLTGLEPTLGFTAPFTLAANVRGMEQLLSDIYGEPQFAAALFERLCQEVLAPWILHQHHKFPNASTVRGADATASIPIVNLRLLQQWALHYVLRLRELTGLHVTVANWVGESLLKQPAGMLDLKLEACPGVLQGQDPDVERLGPEFYRAYADSRGVSLTLGIGASFLAQAMPEEIGARVRHYVRAGGPGGRFSLYLCNVGGATPPGNLRAAVAGARSPDTAG